MLRIAPDMIKILVRWSFDVYRENINRNIRRRLSKPNRLLKRGGLNVSVLDVSALNVSILTLSLLSLNSCTRTPTHHLQPDVVLPQQWEHNDSVDNLPSWDNLQRNSPLKTLIEKGLKGNHNLQVLKLDMQIAQASWKQQNSALYWPSLSMLFDAQRSHLATNTSDSSIFNLSAAFNYEVNIWGQLSDKKQYAALNFASKQAIFHDAQNALAKDIAIAWFNYLSAQELLILYTQRLNNLKHNVDTIESQYQSGLIDALNVYLARNEYEREQATLEEQKHNASNAHRTLSLLIGSFPNLKNLTPTDPDSEKPDTQDLVMSQLPETTLILPAHLPSALLKRRPDLQAAWLKVLQQNASVAIAHKARFPQLILTARSGRSSDQLNNLVASGINTWSLIGSITQPILNGRSLLTAENIARMTLSQLELHYENRVYEAFREMYSAIEQQYTLKSQLDHTNNAAINASQAQSLAFDQYTKGIVNYATVLEAQRRAFDANIQLILLRNQVVNNSAQLLYFLAIEPNTSSSREYLHTDLKPPQKRLKSNGNLIENRTNKSTHNH